MSNAAPDVTARKNGYSIISFAIGIFSILYYFILANKVIWAFGPGLMAISMGWIALVQIKRNGQTGKSLAVGGIVLGSIAVIVPTIALIFYFSVD